MGEVNRNSKKTYVPLITIVLALVYSSVPGIGAVIVYPPNSIYNACPGDMIVITCNITGTILDWIWQNSTTGRKQFRLYGIENAEYNQLNVHYNFPDVPGVTATLLDRTIRTSSSLQFIISAEFENAHIECKNDQRDIVAAKCSATAASFTITHYNGGTNMSSICLLWDTQTNLTFTYYIYLSDDSKTLLNKTTNVSSVAFNLTYGRNYSIDINSNGCGITHIVSTITLILSDCSIGCTTVHGVVTFPENETIEISYVHDLPNSFEYPCRSPITTSSDTEGTDSSIMEGISTSSQVNQQSTSTVIGLIGGLASAVVFAATITIFIAIAVTINSKKRRKEKRTDEDMTTQNDLEYDHIRFSSALQKAHVEPVEYGTLNTEFLHYKSSIPTLNAEEYSTLHEPQSVLVKDDYEYTTINSRNDSKGKKEKYAELNNRGDEDREYSLPVNSTTQNNHDSSSVNYSLIKSAIDPADSLLNLDTMLIELRDIAPKWEELGRHLQFSATDIQQFKHISNGIDFDCLVELCDNWLKITEKPTWKFLAHIMEKMEEQQLSEEILNIYNTGELPDKECKLLDYNFGNGIMTEYEENPPPIPNQNF